MRAQPSRLLHRREAQLRDGHGRKGCAGAAAGDEGVEAAGEEVLGWRGVAGGRGEGGARSAALEGAQEVGGRTEGNARSACASAQAARQRWVSSGAHTHPADGRARPPAQKRTPRTRARARVCARSGLLRRDATRVGLSARPAERGRAPRARWLTWQLTQLTALRLRGAAQQRVRKAGHRVAGRSAAAAAASGAAHQVTQPGHCCVGCGVSPQSHASERHAAATSAMR